MKPKHWMLVIHKNNFIDNKVNLNEVEHFCGWENEPDWKEAKKDLSKELLEDEEFQLEDNIDNYLFIKSTPEITEQINNLIEE
jgi:hypothetical protein